MITAEIIGDREVIARIEGFNPKLRAELLASTKVLNILLLRSVKEKLSGPVLRNRSDHLRASIHGEVTESEARIEAKTGTNVEYAHIHEYGGMTKPHVIKPRNALALHFYMGGKEMFLKSVNHPGSHIPERSYLRSSLKELIPEIYAEYDRAIARALK
jgi:phage gpG-like protein